MLKKVVSLLALLTFGLSETANLTIRKPPRQECIVQSSQNSSIDDAVAITDAFRECGHGGRVVFLNETYYVNSIMNTTGLEDCEIELHGKLLWSKDIQYWLNNSLELEYQNQTSAWFFGGKNIHWKGFGYGTLDGNGQTWYDFVQGVSNYPRRPHQITIWETYNSIFEGLRFVQSQMWTMTIKNSKNLLLENIYVNSTSLSGAPSRNTDGADTMFSSNITFRGWDVDNGDDAISCKANSSDIYVYDSTFRTGQGFAIGSIGQYPGVYEHIENIYVENVTFVKTRWALYIKTWTGVQKNYPPNGGGGGLGYAKNINVKNCTHDRTRGIFQITQCTSFSGQTGDCDTSEFQISDVKFEGHYGSTRSSYVSELQCSGASPCYGIQINNVTLSIDGGLADQYRCDNVFDPIGFNCTD